VGNGKNYRTFKATWSGGGKRGKKKRGERKEKEGGGFPSFTTYQFAFKVRSCRGGKKEGKGKENLEFYSFHVIIVNLEEKRGENAKTLLLRRRKRKRKRVNPTILNPLKREGGRIFEEKK